jgi:hypothetical protein
MVAHLLIDGVARAAIVAIAFSLRAFLRGADERLARVVFAAGIAAGLASFGQAVVGLLLTHRAAHGSAADNVKTLFTVLNDSDTAKIAFLAVMIGTASLIGLRRGRFPRWLAVSGLAFAPLLALSGLAFPLESDALYSALAVTLVLLLKWVVVATVVIARRTRGPEGSPALAS